MLTDTTFHPITLDDRDWIRDALEAEPQEVAMMAFATNYTWNDAGCQVEVARICGCCVYRWRLRNGMRFLTFPFGRGDWLGALRSLREVVGDAEFRFFALSSEQTRRLLSAYGGEFQISFTRDMSDYLYLASDLATLPGGRYQPKRNHVRRFKAAGDWRLDELDGDGIDDCRALLGEWLEEKRLSNPEEAEDLENETMAMRRAFDDFGPAGLIGAILRKGERPVALAIGEALSPTLAVVHFEKALPSVEGASQTINQEFSRLLQARGFEYVNREEDMGIPNLRKAKMSYQPLRLVRKYAARLSDVASATDADRTDIERLWGETFGDPPEYISRFLDAHADAGAFLVIRRDGELAAMCALIDAEIVASGEIASVRYVYALATAPKWRRSGLATRILDAALEHGRTPLVLLPGDNAARDFYRKRGFTDAFIGETWRVGCGDTVPDATFRPADTHLLLRRRESMLEGRDHVKWDEAAIGFAISDCEALGGGALETDRGETVLYYREGGRKLRIVETSALPERRGPVLAALMETAGADEAVYCNAGGMIRYPDEYEGPRITDGYLNLALD